MLSNNCSILLIDDDADVLDAYTQLLEQAGYHVSACNNPFDAREQVPKDWPGIFLNHSSTDIEYRRLGGASLTS